MAQLTSVSLYPSAFTELFALHIVYSTAKKHTIKKKWEMSKLRLSNLLCWDKHVAGLAKHLWVWSKPFSLEQIPALLCSACSHPAPFVCWWYCVVCCAVVAEIPALKIHSLAWWCYQVGTCCFTGVPCERINRPVFEIWLVKRGEPSKELCCHLARERKALFINHGYPPTCYMPIRLFHIVGWL